MLDQARLYYLASCPVWDVEVFPSACCNLEIVLLDARQLLAKREHEASTSGGPGARR
jgi:hypothetical protein